jgi:hypothetical protein
MIQVTKPFYKNPNSIDDVQELRDYVKHLQEEVFKLIDTYNDLSLRYDNQEVRINQVFVMAGNIREKINEGYHK